MKKNKRLIFIFCVFVFIVLAAVVSSAVFSLQNADLFFKNEYDEFTDVDLSKYPEFNLWQSLSGYKGKSILFLDRDEIEKKLEQDYLWLNVVSFEVQFPDALKIVATVRTPVFHFVSGGITYTCDYEGFVMSDKAEDAVSTIRIESAEMSAASIKVGRYLSADDAETTERLLIALWRQREYETYSFATLPLFLDSIRFEGDTAVMTTVLGGKIVIYKPEIEAFEKFTVAYGLFFVRSDKQLDGTFTSGYSKNDDGYIAYIE